jgi:hypothetical protein
MRAKEPPPSNCPGTILHFAALSRLITNVERAVDIGFDTNGFPVSRI